MSKIVNISDGTGTSQLINDTYTVTANITGYDNSSINPSSLSVVEGTNSYAFTVAATGTLTLHVTDDGTASGNPIVGATFYRTDSTGTEYGSSVASDSNGDVVFNNVPFAVADAPIIYYKQTASDGEHEFDATVNNTTMTTDTSTIQVQNPVGATRTITLTDVNYSNLPIGSGTITLTN